MKVLYACTFNLNRYSGKERATRQKLTVLTGLVEKLYIISADKFRLANLLWIDITCINTILRHRPDIFISRGHAGLLPVLLCRFIRCQTVREMHADQISEANLLDKNIFLKKIAKLMGFYTVIIDRAADVRVFNNPKLMRWYDEKYSCGDYDFYCYNGYQNKNQTVIAKKELIFSKYGLTRDLEYLVFTGSASKWHGIPYLVNLQKKINELGYYIRIICAGSRVKDETDPDNVLIKIYPLDDKECDELIGIAKACLLPVSDTRVSPGSPLKLYDYIKCQKFIITQKETLGYSDEVEKYGKGICVDFRNSAETAAVVHHLDTCIPVLTPIEEFSWNARMDKWVNIFERILSNEGK
jgi:hypothetical protein